MLKNYIVVQVKTRVWRVHTIYVLDIKKEENNVSPLTTYRFTYFKVGRKGVYITRTCLHDNFQIWSYTYLKC